LYVAEKVGEDTDLGEEGVPVVGVRTELCLGFY
jgi:hypothetical protein